MSFLLVSVFLINIIPQPSKAWCFNLGYYSNDRLYFYKGVSSFQSSLPWGICSKVGFYWGDVYTVEYTGELDGVRDKATLYTLEGGIGKSIGPIHLTVALNFSGAYLYRAYFTQEYSYFIHCARFGWSINATTYIPLFGKWGIGFEAGYRKIPETDFDRSGLSEGLVYKLSHFYMGLMLGYFKF